MINSVVSPLVSLLLSISLFAAYILLGKYLVLSMPIIQLIFFYHIVSSLIQLFEIRKDLKKKIQFDQIGLQALMSLIYLGFIFCFLGSLSHLPLVSAVAIYLAYPLFVPWVLKMWMGKRLSMPITIGSYIAWVGIVFSFNHKLQLNNVLVVVAAFGAVFKAIYQAGRARLQVSEPPLVLWATKFFTITIATVLLLVGSWSTPHWKMFVIILLFCCIEQAYKLTLKVCFKNYNLLKTINLFNLSIFFCGALDYFIFQSLLPFKSILCAVLIYLGIFFTFLQKNVLSNSVYDI
ncbi:MAG: hypothetical protein S4CHLAM6_14770 [Chlamydiae bacterium]|nr:hypothetical protein [Chlamydiota bacterium]